MFYLFINNVALSVDVGTSKKYRYRGEGLPGSRWENYSGLDCQRGTGWFCVGFGWTHGDIAGIRGKV